MTREIEARTLLIPVRNPQSWFGVNYNMNIYRGCQHGCIYCDSRSECYGIEDFDEVLAKANAQALLRSELSRKRTKGIIGTGAMSDPYTPAERSCGLTAKTMEIIAEFGFGLHMVTKSNLVLKDIDTLKSINRYHASVAFTVTTADDSLARKLEPGAPSPSERFEAMRALGEEGIYAGVTMMPVLPFIEDNEENLIEIVRKTAAAKGRFIIPWLGMTLRDRQRSYYYAQLDRIFPGLSAKYRSRYGSSYSCDVDDAKRLYGVVREECRKYGMATSMKELHYLQGTGQPEFEQLSFFGNNTGQGNI